MVDWGGNYPPGAKNDPNAPYNQPDRSHEHRWEHDEQYVTPMIEDGAAIFHEECQYAEGRYGEGWQCEETRTYRFEYSTLESPSGEKWEIPSIEDWAGSDVVKAMEVRRIEKAFHHHGPGDKVGFDVDPDPNAGVVTIEYKGWTLRYEP
jgi:hypothetical protein